MVSKGTASSASSISASILSSAFLHCFLSSLLIYGMVAFGCAVTDGLQDVSPCKLIKVIKGS